jgi:2-phospho-L-lactate guanylyltransferase
LNAKSPKPDLTFAIVPVNVIRLSKQRLSPILNATDRARLTVAMLNDVLRSARKVQAIKRVTVVSADTKVRRIAKAHNANFIWEGRRRGLNKGVRLAVADTERRGASAVVVIQSDLPYASSLEISRFLARCNSHSVGIVPSRHGDGTNALFLKPPSIMKPLFGKHSCQKHQVQAKQRGLSLKVIRSRAIGFDVDEPEDLRRLLRCRLSGETGKFLRAVKERPRS